MNLLDENIPDDLLTVLRSWGIRVRKIGREIGRKGAQDEQILPLLHRLPRTTFFTRDLGFYDRRLCYAGYCLVCLEIAERDTPTYIRQVLRHPELNTQAKRLGKVIHVGHAGIHLWRLRGEQEEILRWSR